MPGSSDKTRKAQSHLILLIGIATSALFVLLMAVGLVQLGMCGVALVRMSATGSALDGTIADTIPRVLHALELLFVAPLPHLTTFGILRYWRSSINADNSVQAHAELVRIKSLIVGLLVAASATQVLGDASTNQAQGALEWLGKGIVVLALAVYGFGLERSHAATKVEDASRHA